MYKSLVGERGIEPPRQHFMYPSYFSPDKLLRRGAAQIKSKVTTLTGLYVFAIQKYE